MVKIEEIAKSWFVLAEILAILAGLFAVSGGGLLFGFDDIIPTMNGVVDLCESVLEFSPEEYNGSMEICIGDSFDGFTDVIKETQSLALFLLALGFILGTLSLICWFFGRIKIEQEDFRDKLFGLLALIVTVILIIAVYYQLKTLFNI
jgi:hypothetical protein